MAAPVTPARSGLMRSGEGRSGYPIAVGAVPRFYALSGVMRSGAGRSNYHSGKVFVSIGGVHVGTGRADPDVRILWSSLTIRDGLNEFPTTASATAVGFTPTIGQDVIITLGSRANGTREFAGTILRTEVRPLGSHPRRTQIGLALIDYTWGLDAIKVTGFYTGSASAIAAALVATYAPGYTTDITPDLPTLEGGITFTNENLTTCLSRLAKRIGSTWTCDYHKRVCLPARRPGDTDPTPINAVHPTCQGLTVDRDLSQQVTRVHVEGGGVAAAASVPLGETILPLAGATSWYEPAGTVVSGPQRIAYAGVTAGAGGGLVGPGAQPSSAPTLALAAGAVGVTPGFHEYAVTFVTAAGESLPGPRVPITVAGVTDPPAAAPTAGAVQAGAGPDPGVHEYAVTFVTASGETTPGPRVSATTAALAAPSSAPTPGAPTPGAGPDPGSHEYAVTFVTAIGETLAGPIGAGVVTGATPPPATNPTAITVEGTGPDPGWHDYGVTFVTAVGETTVTGASNAVRTGTLAPPATVPTLEQSTDWTQHTTGWSPGDALYYVVTFVTPSGIETPAGPVASQVAVAIPEQDYAGWMVLLNLPIARDELGAVRGGVKRIYRSINGAPSERLAELPNNQPVWTDTGAAGTVADPPTVNNTILRRVNLAAIPTGPAGVTARRLYRRSGGLGFRLVTTIANNTATTYSDSLADAGLGAAPPATSTALLAVVPLTAIPTGPAGVTARRLYRRSAGAGLRLLATLANNTTTTHTDTTPNAGLGAAPPTVATATFGRIPLTAIPRASSSLVTARRLYGTAAGASALLLVATIPDNTTTAYVVTTPDSGLGLAAPATNTATAGQVLITNIPTGAAAVTSRRLYRTVAGGGGLRLVTGLGDNLTTAYQDAVADAALQFAPPTVDTSGLQQPAGAVNPGATTLTIASIGPFPPGGGWAVIGNGQQVIRYSGVSGNTLTGIPASGPGAIVAAIAFNSTVTSAPALVGIPASGPGAIRLVIPQGQDVNLWVTETDLEAAAARAALLGGDGIVEEVVQDRRLAPPEARARARAVLAMKRAPLATARYTCRDLNTRGGRTIRINLGPPYEVRDVALLVQSVTETFPLVAARLMPTFAVDASSVRLTFEEWLATVRRE